ncbi:META domain-containing protein [Cellulomonas wangsupingiae]|uniref:META domain-containing protein n=1 Tax=Cellulomonas wangsupingiae TaxID=2968085 RepID=A0ABY5K4X8_9CELL|nr:META domain-containing protein [Cellulomonas wangsupingiae]MCC2335731.1 META domain-containing protein [Cellulomonas wangsupingiae]UUI63966.1 META domain-containing protein [Cellulomonas wangsupingiae]
MREHGQDEPTTADLTGGIPDAPWLHGTWQVARIDGAEPAAGLQGPPWLTFEGDGVVFGYAGVNRVRGTWRLDGSTLTFGPVVATLMAGPADATATERSVLAVLQDGGTVTPGPEGCGVRTPAGRTAELVRTSARPAADPPVDAGPHVLH